MTASEGLAAGVFYLALAATVGGAIGLARGAVERRAGGNRFWFVLLAAGLVGIGISVAVYVTGPRRILPF